MEARPFYRHPVWSFIFKILLSATALFIVFRNVDTKEVGQLFLHSQWAYFLPVILLVGLSKVLSSFRLNMFFRAIGLQLREVQNLRLYWLGIYYNLFLPGGIGGDAYKVFLLRKQGVARTKELVWASLLDRGMGMLVLVVFALALLSGLSVEISWMNYAWIGIPIALVGGWLIMFWSGKKYIPLYPGTLAWSLGVQGLQLLAVYLLLKMIGQPPPYTGFLFLFLLSSLLTALPISYGGAGAREIAFFYGATYLGLPEAPAVSVSLLFYLASLLVSLSGMVYSFKPLALNGQVELDH
jgi:uncharacterized membrane protein YbhN (UPF0104 family)